MNASFSADDPKVKLLTSLRISLDKWQADIKVGKDILSQIAEKKKKTNPPESTNSSSEEKEPNYLDPELQDLCDALRRVTENLCDRKTNFVRVAEKLATFAELDQATARGTVSSRKSGGLTEILSTSDLSGYVDHLCGRYAEQYDYCVGVLEEVMLCQSEDELMFLQAVWLQQPALDEKCDIAAKVVNSQIE